MEELIALRARQLAKREKELAIAFEQQKEVRKKAVDDFNKRYEKQLVSNDFDIGTWVLVHETWLDGQKGNKGALRWSGPFVVHAKYNNRTYRLREIDGTVKRNTIDKHRLKIFYFRDDYQTIKTVNKIEYAAAKIMEDASDVAKFFLNGLFSNRFRGSNIPRYLIQGENACVINDDLTRHPIFIKRGFETPLFNDLKHEEVWLVNAGTRLEDPKNKFRQSIVSWTSVEWAEKWAEEERRNGDVSF